MNIRIEGHNIKITEQMEEYTHKRLDRIDRYLPNIRDVHVEFTHENTRRTDDLISAQITVKHERGAIIRAEEKVRSSYELALNQAIEKLYRRIERFKNKRARKGKVRFSEVLMATAEEMQIAEDIPAEEFTENTEILYADYAEQADEVIRRKALTITPMSEYEAIEQMELLGHQFFVYTNVEDGKINIVYRRDEGNYGILVPNA